MSKPIHKFAILLWAAAVLYGITDISTFNYARHLAREGDGSFYGNLEPIMIIGRTLIVTCGLLAGLGFVIELLDQIRWQLSQAER